jgi:tRNA threonylcarbamoyladenosine biosynthesis protein TsaB
MEVFCAGYSGTGAEVFPTRAEILRPDSFPEAKGFDKKYIFGDGAAKTLEILEPAGFQLIKNIHTGSAQMAPLAEDAFQSKQFVDTAYFEPFYLKDFVAGKPKGR